MIKIHHIGYAVENIDLALDEFIKLGYKKNCEIIEDSIRKIKIIFLEKDGYVVELVSPNGEGNPVDSILKKNGATLYHICYEVDSVEEKTLELRKSGYMRISNIDVAPAINNKKVVFLYHKLIGIIELVES